MAKKTKSTSYAPNPSLIAGEAVARKYQSGSGGESTKAFTEGFMTTYMAGVAEKKIREAKLDAAISKIPNINSWRALDSGANKQAVKMWAREQKDEYARLYEIYEKTKDRDVKDQMDNIEFAFTNLDTQIKGFTDETKNYVKAADSHELASRKSYEEHANLFDNIFTGGGEFTIANNGDLGFDGNNYQDITGKWNVNNVKGKQLLLTTNASATESGVNGQGFFRDITKSNIKAELWKDGPEGIQTLATEDLTGDDQYIIGQDENGNDIYSEDQSFEAMWESGNLNEKFYKGFTANKEGTYDTKWMFDDPNAEKLNDLMSEYYTDVNEFSHGQGKANYDVRVKENALLNKGRDTFPVGYGGGYITRVSADNFYSDIKEKKEIIQSPNGSYFKLVDGQYWSQGKNKEGELTGEYGPKAEGSGLSSNQFLLKDAGIWNQGYQLDNYAGAGATSSENFEPEGTGTKEDPITRKRKKGETLKEGDYWKSPNGMLWRVNKNGKWVEVK